MGLGVMCQGSFNDNPSEMISLLTKKNKTCYLREDGDRKAWFGGGLLSEVRNELEADRLVSLWVEESSPVPPKLA